jgi:hypothetical protein
MQLTLRDDLPFLSVTVAYQGVEIEIPDVLVDTGSATVLALLERTGQSRRSWLLLRFRSSGLTTWTGTKPPFCRRSSTWVRISSRYAVRWRCTRPGSARWDTLQKERACPSEI